MHCRDSLSARPQFPLGVLPLFKQGWSTSPDPFLIDPLRLLYSLKAALWRALKYPASDPSPGSVEIHRLVFHLKKTAILPLERWGDIFEKLLRQPPATPPAEVASLYHMSPVTFPHTVRSWFKRRVYDLKSSRLPKAARSVWKQPLLPKVFLWAPKGHTGFKVEM